MRLIASGVILSMLFWSCEGGQRPVYSSRTDHTKDDSMAKSPTADETKEVRRTPLEVDTVEKNRGFGPDELTDQYDRRVFAVSVYNTDMPDVSHISRPSQSSIANFGFDTSHLFKIWTLYPDGPHASFRVDADEFFVVDYDGDGSMPYEIDGRLIKVYYNDFKKQGLINRLTRDTLIINWKDAGKPAVYSVWDQ